MLNSKKSQDDKYDPYITAVDLFCGAGGLTHGLNKAGIKVDAGIDIDENVKYPFEENNSSTFYCWDLAKKQFRSIEKLFADKPVKLLAGCAPCQPFSKYTRAHPKHEAFDMLNHFGRIASSIKPEIVMMENVPELADRGRVILDKFIKSLEKSGYVSIEWRVVLCSEYRVPQNRNRLVLLASRLGDIEIPQGKSKSLKSQKTVRQAIGKLRPLKSGETDSKDLLHNAALLSPTNLERIKHTPHDGGTRHSWPDHLTLECHKKKSGQNYFSIYGRMWWDKPAPTMTTLCTGYGNGRFGHPDQDRSITLREAAMIQSFPKSYQFWPSSETLNKGAVSRMIGNAVPPALAKALGDTIRSHVYEHLNKRRGNI